MKYVTHETTLEGRLCAVAQVYRDHFATFMLVSALVWVPATLVTAAFMGAAVLGVASPLALAMTLVPLTPLAVALFVQGAAIEVAIAEATLDQRPSVASAYSGALRKLGSLFVVSLVYGLIVVAGFIAFVVPGFFFMFRYAYAPGIVIVENATPMDALRRSAKLSEGRKADLFVTMFVISLVTAVIVKIWMVVFGGVPFLGAFFDAVPQIVLAPIAPLVTMLDYLRARQVEAAQPTDVPAP